MNLQEVLLIGGMGYVGDVKSIILECSRIKTEVGWKPVVEMSEGIKRTWEWMQKLLL